MPCQERNHPSQADFIGHGQCGDQETGGHDGGQAFEQVQRAEQEANGARPHMPMAIRALNTT